MRLLVLATAVALLPCAAVAQTAVEKIKSLVEGKPAEVGVAWIAGGKAASVNNGAEYPLMSVFKTHAAVAALRRMQRAGTPTDTLIRVEAEEMAKDTYSPLLKLHPEGGFTIRFDSLLHYSVALSDNNACDVIIRLAGGIRAVGQEMRSIGLADFSLTETEASMHADPTRSYNNRSTPLSAACLFRKIYEGGILTGGYADLLKRTLAATSTGPDKMAAALGPGMALAHKTGTGFTLDDGTMTADNDAGAITLPDGRRIYVAVLVKDSKLGPAGNARLIREITKTIIDFGI